MNGFVQFSNGRTIQKLTSMKSGFWINPNFEGSVFGSPLYMQNNITFKHLAGALVLKTQTHTTQAMITTEWTDFKKILLNILLDINTCLEQKNFVCVILCEIFLYVYCKDWYFWHVRFSWHSILTVHKTASQPPPSFGYYGHQLFFVQLMNVQLLDYSSQSRRINLV